MTSPTPSAIRLRLTGAATVASVPPVCYRVAGRRVVADREIPALSGLRARDANASTIVPPQPAPRDDSMSRRTLFDGTASLGGKPHRVTSAVGPRGYEIEVAAVARCVVSADGADVRCVGTQPLGATCLVDEAALGPALAIALALKGVFLLHASGVRSDDGVVVLCGPSGAGKSTLARRLSSPDDLAWPLVADDILPLEWSAGRLVAHADFPQPRFAPERQPGRRISSPQPVSRLLLVDATRSVGASGGTAATGELLVPVAAVRAVRALAEQTIALRLLDDRLRAAHLAFSAAAVEHAGVHMLRNRHVPGGLDAAVEAIASACRRPPPERDRR